MKKLMLLPILCLLIPLVHANVGIVSFEYETAAENMAIDFSVANRGDTVRADLTAEATLLRKSDGSEIATNDRQFSLAAKGVEDLSLELDTSTVPKGEYKLLLDIKDPAGKPIATIFDSLEITTGTSETIYFTQVPYLEYVTEGDGTRAIRYSYGDEGKKVSEDATTTILFSLKNGFNEAVDLTADIKMIGSYSKKTVHTIEENLETIPAGEKSSFRIPLETQEPGTYDARVTITHEGKELVKRDLRVVFAGESANILEISNAQDTYQKGETVNLDVTYVGPADGVSVITGAYLKMELIKDGSVLETLRHEDLTLGFNRQTDSFSLTAPENLEDYSVHITLGKGSTIFDETNTGYKEITNTRTISGDGRIYDPAATCFDDGECTEEELNNDCFDCRKHPDEQQPSSELKEKYSKEKLMEEETSDETDGNNILIMVGGILAALLVGAIIFMGKSKKQFVLLLVPLLCLSAMEIVQADPTSSPGPPPATTTTTPTPAPAFTQSCGGNNATMAGNNGLSYDSGYTPSSYGLQPGDTYTYCEDGDYTQWDEVTVQGGTVINETTWYTCGQNNNSWQTATVSEDWCDCPRGERVAEMHEPGNLTTGFSSLSYNAPGGILFSGEEEDFTFNAYVEACLNRIPLLRLQLDMTEELDEGTNPVSHSKTGIYAKHQTINYTGEHAGKLGKFEIPEQEAFKKTYNISSDLNSYRFWSWRYEFGDALKQTVRNKGLSIPYSGSVDDLSPNMDHTVGDLYLSETYMEGGLNVTVGQSGFANAVIHELEIMGECTLSVYDLNLPGVTDDANAVETALQDPANVQSLMDQIENNPDWCNMDEGVEIENVSFIEAVELPIYDNVSRNYSVTVSDLDIQGVTNANQLETFLGDEDNYENFTNGLINLGELAPDDFIQEVKDVQGGAIADIDTVTMEAVGSGEVGAKVDLHYFVESSSNTSWSWRALENVTMDELARCLYNWDACLLDPRNGSVAWEMYSIADLGYGTGVNTSTYNWSRQRVDNYSIYYDGARGEEYYSFNVTVYRNCETGEPWISEAGDHACVNGSIYRCRFTPDAGTGGFVTKKEIGSTLIINETSDLGYRCSYEGEWIYRR
ncbi:MAG: hypothetical protein ACQESG_06370 [Nanobdellota archaeon]